MSAYKLPYKEYKSEIRQINLGNTIIGGENALPFMVSELNKIQKPAVAIEILLNIPSNYPVLLKTAWGECINNPIDWAKKAVELNPDLLAVRFNINEKQIETDIQKSCDIVKELTSTISKPLIFTGSGKKEIDIQLLPALAESASKSCIFGFVEEDSYRDIIPALNKYNHFVVARTPIDVNLAKELNILISEQGHDAERILIDPNMGGLGYGLDYAYSVIERIKQAGLDGDKMLNMPILTYIGEEAWKAKEAKSSDFTDNWGDLTDRAIIWECLTASSVMVAGSNLLVMWHPQAAKEIMEFINQK